MHRVVRVKSEQVFPLIKEMLEDGSKVSITVTGNSMFPFLRNERDSVELSKADFDKIARGDIVLVRRDSGMYVLHRVLRKNEDCFYMVGDNQQWVEGPLRPNQLIAVTTAIIRGGRRIECNNLLLRCLVSAWQFLLPFRYRIKRVLHYPYKLLKKFNSSLL